MRLRLLALIALLAIFFSVSNGKSQSPIAQAQSPPVICIFCQTDDVPPVDIKNRHYPSFYDEGNSINTTNILPIEPQADFFLYLPLIFKAPEPTPPDNWNEPEMLIGPFIFGSELHRYPVIDIGRQAHLHIAWFTEFGDGTETVEYINKSEGGSWSSSEEVFYPVYQGRDRPTIAIDSSETAHMAWRNRDKGHWAGLDYAFKTGGGSWSARYEFNTPWHVNAPSLIVDDSGTLHMIWTDVQHDPGPSNILYATKSPGGYWSSPITIHANDDNTYMTTLAVAADGALHSAWQNQNSHGDWQVYYAVRPAGGGWSAPSAMSGVTYPGAGLDIAIDSNDTVHLVWADFSGSNPSIRYAMKSTGSNWSSPVNISANPNGRYIWPSIAIDQTTNTLYVVWMEDAYGSDLHLTYALPGGFWAAPVRLTTTGDTYVYPHIAVDGYGDVHLVWEQYTEAIYYMAGNHSSDAP